VAEDKPLTCGDCGKTFTWTSEEQEMFQRRGFFNEPKRCPGCRKTRRDTRTGGGRGFGGGGGGGDRSFGGGGGGGRFNRSGPPRGGGGGMRQSFTVQCAKCGRDAVVPFKPRGDRPVYCNDCFRS
jgi:CxxC-x17-CxxC domain-containing protein